MLVRIHYFFEFVSVTKNLVFTALNESGISMICIFFTLLLDDSMTSFSLETLMKPCLFR